MYLVMKVPLTQFLSLPPLSSSLSLSSPSLEVSDSMAQFHAAGVCSYSILTLSENDSVLYVGAREALFALDPNDISKQLRPQVEKMFAA